ncbi:hypothetical protein PHYBOEH_001455 [Phytophthora boehmeriae]|uniref:PX domain-containing protein n=1 Tax=Phytophthora boehmeriae TaxID=109152 RepID=A0A8T1WTZ3_9STRA|nr:hypothetical protein PHYBOEH_001455 [Phytophthora boehmeriae]
MASRTSQIRTVRPMPFSLPGVGESRARRLSEENIAIATADEKSGSAHRLSLDAHHRWMATKAVKFLRTIAKISIDTTQTKEDDVYYVVEVDIKASELNSDSSPTTYRVERCFSEFEELRENISVIVNRLPPCRCAYCIDFLLYIRFNSQQPRGIVKMVGTTEKRRQVLTAFINNLVHLGQRRTQQNTSKRGCKAQAIVPALIETFLVDNAEDTAPTRQCSEQFSVC